MMKKEEECLHIQFRDVILKKQANLKLFKTSIHSLVKFSPHSAKIHRLFNDFIVIFSLIRTHISINILNKIVEIAASVYKMRGTNKQIHTSFGSTGSANISCVSLLNVKRIHFNISNESGIYNRNILIYHNL